jgi:hypothetical protein
MSDESAESVEEGPIESAARRATPLPPPDFSSLVQVFSTQAMIALGVFANPLSGKVERRLEVAKHFIDLLGLIETKTRGNLDPQEKELLEVSLHELRMGYVHVVSQPLPEPQAADVGEA